MIVCWTVSPPIGSCGGRGARDVTFDVGCVARALSMGLVFRRCSPVLSREVRLRTGEAPPLRRDLLEALDGRLGRMS